jgi:hypothetical protein
VVVFFAFTVSGLAATASIAAKTLLARGSEFRVARGVAGADVARTIEQWHQMIAAGAR